MDKSVPKTTRSTKKIIKPCWWNQNVEEKRHNLNKSQRAFKLRNTPANLSTLNIAEEEYVKAKDLALENWSENICTSINHSRNIKDKWSEFRKFTKKKTDNTILPFIQQNNDVIFDESDKAKELEHTFFKGKHLREDIFDKSFHQEVMVEYTNITMKDSMDSVQEDEIYNSEIAMEELEGAISRLKKDSAPGPDSIFPVLLMDADKEVLESLLAIFNKSWKEGNLPKQWKRANVKFLKKPCKPNYNSPSSYRPISLTSIVGKLMERVITSRLEAFVEENNILDEEQEGFRQLRSTTNALLNLTQSISAGFNEDKFTLAVFIDFEKAYDSVWREGLMVKLHRFGITGKMWIWIHNFLEERYARCLVNKNTGDWFNTSIGLPQGAVISPILFNLYVKDLFEEVHANKCKFADDSTLWNTGTNLVKVTADTQSNLEVVENWSKKWRININVDKTEYCIFSRQKHHPGLTQLKLHNREIK